MKHHEWSRGGIRGHTQGSSCLLAGCAALATLSPATTDALGVRIPNQDPTAIARGNAFAATADNPSAIYYNPAGITQLPGHNVQLGSLLYMNIYADYKSPSGDRVENDPEVIPVPQLHYVFTPQKLPVSFGLGVYAPYGLSMTWPEDAPFATGGTEGRLTYVTVNPVAAVKLGRELSLAIGPMINYSELSLRQAAGILPGDEFKFKGDDIGYGFNVGLLWQPYTQWSFGLTYRSTAKMEYDGTAALRPNPPLPGAFPSSAPIKFPQIITGGVSFRPTANWNLEVNVDWTDWDSVDSLDIEGVPSRRLDWEPSFFYQFGVTRKLPNGYFVSGGYFFSEVSTSERYFISAVPDTDLHVGSVGVGRKGERWNWAAAVQLIGGEYRTIDENINPAVNGRYRLFTPTFSFSVGCHF